MKEGLPFSGDLSPKNSEDSYAFGWFYFIDCLTLSSIIAALFFVHSFYSNFI